MGGAVGGAIDKVTGADKAKKAAEEARKRQEELIRQQEAERKREEQFQKDLEKDSEKIEQVQTESMTQPKVNTTVDFSKAMKVEDDDEDKLKKAFRSFGR